MQYLLCSMIILSSIFSFAEDTPAAAPVATPAPAAVSAPKSSSSSGDFNAADMAQVGSLLGNLTGNKSVGQLGNAAALIQGIGQLGDTLKKLPKTATSITTSSDAKTFDFIKIQNGITALGLQAKTAQAEAAAMIPVGTADVAKAQALVAALYQLSSTVDTYRTQKKVCTTEAETAEYLCVEGNSPGSVKVKALMELATPALSLISSAQKACSTTATISDIAGKGLVLAKAACVGAKALCSSTCGKSQESLITNITQKINAISDMAPTTMVASVASFVSQSNALVAAESAPAQEGAAGWLVAKCESHTKDLIMLGLNIVSLATAKSSAEKCAADLATNATKTAAQYCEVSANASSQYCLCQKNSAAQGCAGYVATTATATEAAAAEVGVDVKSTGTGNQFASSGTGVKPTSALGSVDGLGSGTAATTGTDSTAAAKTASGFSGNGSSGPGGSGLSAPTANLDGASDAKKGSDAKKWSFGAFMGSGGSYGGDSSSNANGNNKLGQKDMDAAKRQIASEQLRAEVSEASGKSNWEKVRERYLRNTTTLLSGK